jgi:hypothetical protein
MQLLVAFSEQRADAGKFGFHLRATTYGYLDVAHISHRNGVDDMVRIGREVERRVLAQAMRRHLRRPSVGGGDPHGCL